MGILDDNLKGIDGYKNNIPSVKNSPNINGESAIDIYYRDILNNQQNQNNLMQQGLNYINNNTKPYIDNLVNGYNNLKTDINNKLNNRQPIINQPNIVQQPVNNVQQPINSIQQGIKYQNVQPFKTMFDSTGAINQQPANQNAGNPYMDNFKFNQDTFNQGLRDTANQGYQDSRDNFLNIARNIKNASISDMMQMAIEGNQYRQDMRKNQADFTNANSLASKNLEQQNDSGLKDLINQRSTFNDQQRLNNDDTRLRMEQERLNQQQLQTNTENNYKQDYLNRYLLPQLAQQQANQNAQMQFQRDLNAGNLLDNKNRVELYNTIDKIEELKRSAYQQAVKDYKPIARTQTVVDENGFPIQTSSLLDKDTVLKFKTEQILNSNPEYNNLDQQAKQFLIRQSLNQPKNTNNLQGEIEMTDPLTGATIKYKGNEKQINEIKNSIASNKKQ